MHGLRSNSLPTHGDMNCRGEANSSASPEAQPSEEGSALHYFSQPPARCGRGTLLQPTPRSEPSRAANDPQTVSPLVQGCPGQATEDTPRILGYGFGVTVAKIKGLKATGDSVPCLLMLPSVPPRARLAQRAATNISTGDQNMAHRLKTINHLSTKTEMHAVSSKPSSAAGATRDLTAGCCC